MLTGHCVDARHKHNDAWLQQQSEVMMGCQPNGSSNAGTGVPAGTLPSASVCFVSRCSPGL
jgi:hypothetical protein